MKCPQKNEGVPCGLPAFSVGSDYCEKHYSNRYPTCYERMKREIPCDFENNPTGGCGGSGWKTVYDQDLRQDRNVTCSKCGGRGLIDPRHIVEKKP